MPIVQWNENLSVGVDAMDMQHKKLIDLINKLFDAMKSGQGKQMLKSVLTELVSYTRVHLSAEEKFLQDHNYPKLAEHKEMHQRLLAKVKEFCDKFNSGDLGISISLCDFLQKWLKSHICNVDRQYGLYINSQTVAAK